MFPIQAQEQQVDPTKDDDGIFLSESLLIDWHRQMKARTPGISHTNDDTSLFGRFPGQHACGTRLNRSVEHSNSDPFMPVQCEIRGSRWQQESSHLNYPDNRVPMYVILMNGKLSQLSFASAHEQADGEWIVPRKRGGLVPLVIALAFFIIVHWKRKED